MKGNTLLEQSLRDACIDFKVAPENRNKFVLSLLQAIEDNYDSPDALCLRRVLQGYYSAAQACKADCTLNEDRFAEAISLAADRYLAELFAFGLHREVVR